MIFEILFGGILFNIDEDVYSRSTTTEDFSVMRKMNITFEEEHYFRTMQEVIYEKYIQLIRDCFSFQKNEAVLLT